MVRLPLPRFGAGRRSPPASYANFYIVNAAVLAPAFGAAEDRKAAAILRRVFRGRRVVPIACRPLVEGLGGLHCVTQQEPAR